MKKENRSVSLDILSKIADYCLEQVEVAVR